MASGLQGAYNHSSKGITLEHLENNCRCANWREENYQLDEHLSSGFQCNIQSVCVYSVTASWLTHLDCNNLPGSSVHRILQVRMLEWVDISSSRGCTNPGIEPRSPTLKANSLPSESPSIHRVSVKNYFVYS